MSGYNTSTRHIINPNSIGTYRFIKSLYIISIDDIETNTTHKPISGIAQTKVKDISVPGHPRHDEQHTHVEITSAPKNQSQDTTKYQMHD